MQSNNFSSAVTKNGISDTEDIDNKTKSVHSGVISEETLGKGSTYFPAGNQKVIKGNIPVQTKLNPETTKQFEDKKVLLAEIQELKEKLLLKEEQNLVLSTTHVSQDKQYEQKISVLQDTIEDYKKRLNKEILKCNEVNAILQKTNNDMNELEEKLQKSENNKNKYIKEVKALQDNNHRLNETVEQKDEEIHRVKSQHAVLSHRLQESENKFKSHESMVKTKGKEYKEFIEKLKMANEQFYHQTDQMKKVIKEQDLHVNELETEREELNKRLHDLQTANKEAKVKLKEQHQHISKMGTEREKLQKRLQDAEIVNKKAQVRLKEQDQHVRELEIKTEKLTQRLQDIQSVQREADVEQQNKTQQIMDTLSTENQQICQANKELNEKLKLSIAKTKELQKQVESLTYRLSQEATTSNETANITPNDIAEEYVSLCNQEWVDVKEELDRLCGDSGVEDRHRLLCKVLLEAENVASLKYDELVMSLSELLCDPVSEHHRSKNIGNRTFGTNVQVIVSEDSMDSDTDEMTSDSKLDNFTILFEVGDEPIVEKAEENNISDRVVTSVVNCIKQQSGQVKVDGVLKDIMKNINRKKSKKLISNIKDSPCFKTYITECLRLAWRMVTQTPKMNFSIKGIGKAWDDTYQQVLSDTEHNGSVVQYYQYPTLLYGDQLLVRGQVVLNNQQ